MHFRTFMPTLSLAAFLLASCGGGSQSKREIEGKKKEIEKVEIETVELSRTATERRVKVQTKGRSHALSVASQPAGVECPDELWGGIKGKCWAEGDERSGERLEWILLIRKDVDIRFGFFVTGCDKGLFTDSCESETVYKSIVIKGP